MPSAVPGQEGNVPPGDAPDDIGIGWRPPRSVDSHLAAIFERIHVVQAAAADDSDAWAHELTIVVNGSGGSD